MFTIIIIIFIAVSFLILIIHGCRKLCEDPGPALSYRDPPSPASPPQAPMPGLPSLPSGAIPVGLEPPPYSEVGPYWVLDTQLSLGRGQGGLWVVGAGAMGWWGYGWWVLGLCVLGLWGGG